MTIKGAGLGVPLRPILVALSASWITACGGGGGSGGGGGGNTNTNPNPPPSTPPPTALTGQFKEGVNVAGLSYATDSKSGVTDEMGSFSYADGESVEFSIGGVSLGSVPARDIVTPVGLVPGGSSGSVDVQNIARFLLMLDEDADPSDGIAISKAVRDIAANWTQVDFASQDFANEDEVVAIVSDVSSVDGRAAALPDAATAEAQLDATFYCMMSGAFTGSFAGDRTGTVVFLVLPVTGEVAATYLGNGGTDTTFRSAAAPSVDLQRTFRVVRPTDGASFEGRFDSYDELSGVWTFGSDAGSFSATRMLPASISYRYTGTWTEGGSSTKGMSHINVFNVDERDRIDAIAFVVPEVDSNIHYGSGTVSGTDFHVNWDNGTVGSGTIDPATLSMTGTFSSTGGGHGQSDAQGCRLN